MLYYEQIHVSEGIDINNTNYQLQARVVITDLSFVIF